MANAVSKYTGTLDTSVENTRKSFEDVNETVDSVRDSIAEAFGAEEVANFNDYLLNAYDSVENINDGLEDTTDIVGNLYNVVTAIGKTVNLTFIYRVLKKIFGLVSDMQDEASDYIETVNFFNRTFGEGTDDLDEYYQKAIAYNEKMEELLGTNIQETMQWQATFNNMFKSMSISEDAAATMSQSLMALGYDLQSLYNIEDIDTVMSALESGVIGGQSKTMRNNLGIDITDESVQSALNSLGIDLDVSGLTQAEKIVARYITILQQATTAQGDLARTIESPANQLRIFNNQVTTLKRNIAMLWQNWLVEVMPYVNAVLKLINTLIERMATLFGWEYTSFSNTTSSVTEDLEEAVESANELKNALMGFDEIHNLTESDTSSTDSSSLINQALLDALEEYDNLMDSIDDETDSILEKWLEWWESGSGIEGKLKNILDTVELIGVAFLSWKISSTITDLLKNLGVFGTGLEAAQTAFQWAFGITLTITGIYAMYSGTKKLLNGEITLYNVLETLFGVGASTLGIAYLVKLITGGKSLSLGDLGVGFGITLAIEGFILFHEGIKKIIDGTAEIKDILLAIAGIIGGSAGAAIIITKALGGTVLSIGTLQLGFKIALVMLGIEGATQAWDYIQESVTEDLEEDPVLSNGTILTSILSMTLSGAMIGSIGGGIRCWYRSNYRNCCRNGIYYIRLL